ncbi:uncharacterized protein LOC105286325 isoform X1 [Ooceraea biroi]|uniref:uncharacterized protein LOC105286325 isoform X1 n=1 Tax=Ooceraea biroi TaxID=2015173 RepID=UPI0005BB8450|nr:uncharacterized protein LOC105286325 isoform X1 [Ooceraea biroi]XP_011349503.1 uncharacterized protein LOC105286325 isoform X1 [Ooceraea biroi]XP_011349504.1 uncharacterized protein LOC105286325 isoform X1 [Ooceraea biroi]
MMTTMTTRCHWLLLVSSLLILGCILESQQLVIKSVNVPSAVKIGDVDHVILDCDYALENTSSHGLVVKWFFNDEQVVYQWIYGRVPVANELIARYVDLTYKASDDPFTEYRAIKLNKPGIHLTGDYTCVISTFEDERAANASMVIYSTEESFDFEYRKKNIDDKDILETTCKAKGLYPQPTLNISVKDVAEKQTLKPTVTLREDGLYDILSRVDLLDEQLPEAAELKCTLDIPRANYSVSRKTVYYSAGTASATSSATTIPHKMDIQTLDSSNSGNLVNRASISLVLLPIHLAIFTLF